MKVGDLICIMKIAGKTIPRDMVEQLKKTYLSESRGDYIKLGDMDIIHMVRAFNKMHQEKTDLINTIYHKYVKTKELDG
jgi:hypothetical protein|tara:strand:+ start:2995 stop:3231 length:237 start_codon:yes stop_codon:yes gene_type:complete